MLRELVGGVAQRAEVVVVARNSLGDLLDLVRPERAVGNDGLTQVEICNWRHLRISLRVGQVWQPDGLPFGLATSGRPVRAIVRLESLTSGKSQRSESNRQPPHYECGALPIEATLAWRKPERKTLVTV